MSSLNLMTPMETRDYFTRESFFFTLPLHSQPSPSWLPLILRSPSYHHFSPISVSPPPPPATWITFSILCILVCFIHLHFLPHKLNQSLPPWNPSFFWFLLSFPPNMDMQRTVGAVKKRRTCKSTPTTFAVGQQDYAALNSLRLTPRLGKAWNENGVHCKYRIRLYEEFWWIREMGHKESRVSLQIKQWAGENRILGCT